MVWRKKRQHATEGGGDHRGAVRQHTTQGSGRSDGAAYVSSTGLEGALVPQDKLSPQNQDVLKGTWQSDTREFSLPVAHSQSRRAYVIPRNYRISGNLSSARQILVYGDFATGVLEAPTVTVAPSGSVRGRVATNNLQVSGTVDAQVYARVGVEVSGRGRLSGEIHSPALKVWPGAALHASRLKVGLNAYPQLLNLG
jgi:cytoskeletal protein CcmA (bactofilin family)